ncbi:MAG TPA: glycosyl transferase family protein [Croceibacterium sp.]|nr:glycosyl transferase family protein [Croceibacterium sp.]
MGQWTPLEWLALVEHELLLFAAVFFLIGALDELAVDAGWAWLKLTGRARTWRIRRSEARERPLSGAAAVLIPAWHEAPVIEFTIAHALAAWPQAELRLYVGCYCNDPATLEAVMRGSGGDPRVRAVVHGRHGPTTKADCLNRLYAALEDDERRSGRAVRLVVLHDAEDMVDPAALALLDGALAEADFVQLPVLPDAQRYSRWVGSHYCEEFAEAHGKAMVVREALGAAMPSAGVGCGLARGLLGAMVQESGAAGPFSVESLTEDYELGLRVKAAGGRSRFLRVRGEDGQLVATRACFPARIDHAVRQKARWVHGIALQGWDRLGWSGGLGEWWMRLRDRRGPLTALVLFAGYAMFALGLVLVAAHALGLARPWRMDPWLEVLIAINVAAFAWRAAMRFAFTAREYGWREGVWAVMRLPVANVIAIMAGRRALAAYVGSLRGARPQWDKTFHHAHPAAMALGRAG